MFGARDLKTGNPATPRDGFKNLGNHDERFNSRFFNRAPGRLKIAEKAIKSCKLFAGGREKAVNG